ncbi:MAG TPA: hypothetical protein VHI52_13965 [Verrucomicrobiae bacterium]|nr:hypothetical protein [Verrucomicrobiae bacterium]
MALALGVPNGSLRLVSSRVSGDVYVDGYRVGYWAKGQEFVVDHLMTGVHAVVIKDRDSSFAISAPDGGKFTVEPGKITVLAWELPSPQTNLRTISGG